MVLSNDMAALIGFGLETLFYGAYCVLFMGSSTILLWRRRGRLLNVPMVVANFALFFCCTAHFALEFNHYYTTLEATGVPGYANENKNLEGADLLISLTDMFGDFVLLYRCWHVWGRRYYIIILPFLTAVAGFACTAEIIHLLEDLDPSAPVAPASLVPLGIAAYTLPLFTNVMVTSLIVGRIWWITRRLAGVDTTRSSGASVRRAMVILAESGALYLVTQLIFVIVFALKHPSQAIMGVVAVQIYGIAPTLIIIGVELGISSDQMTTNATLTSFQARRTFPESSRTFTTVASSELTYGNPQSPMRLSHLKKVDSDGDFKAPEF